MRVDAGDSVNLLEYSHDGARLAAATANGNVLVWDITSGELVNPLGRYRASGPLDFSADDRTLLIGQDDSVTSWDLTGERELFSIRRASDSAEYDVSKPAPNGRTWCARGPAGCGSSTTRPGARPRHGGCSRPTTTTCGHRTPPAC